MNVSVGAGSAKIAALQARYGVDALPAAGPWNDTLALLLSHRSVRAYRTDPLPAGTLETLMAAAQSAATSSNLQTWSVVTVTDPAKKKVLAEIANNQKHIEQCPLFLVFLADVSRLDRLAAAKGMTFEGLPYVETFLVAAIDAALAAQNAVIAAESLGLSTVYIGAMRNDVERVAQILELPKGAAGVFGLCVGYADPSTAAEVKPRLQQDAVLFTDRYVMPNETAQRAAYDEKLATFSKRNEMVHQSWTDRVISRIAKTKSLNGRDRLRAALAAIGFPLN
ncbi:MAG: nitroreductase family protein [Hyphomicrobiaceae bacterium]